MGTITISRAGQSVSVSDSDPFLLTVARLRLQRNVLLASSDWRDLPSYAGPKQAEWRVYRQALRDMTSGLDTADKVKAATFPTEPS